MATDFIDGQTVVNWVQRSRRAMKSCSYVTGFPPRLMLLKQVVSKLSRCVTFDSFCEFLISPKDDNACPFLRARYFVHFNANEGVGAQPFYLLADGGKTVDPLIVISKIERCHVGLRLVRAGKPTKSATSQEVQTDIPRKLLNMHCVSPGILRNLACHADMIDVSSIANF
jgi:hypothetical protein